MWCRLGTKKPFFLSLSCTEWQNRSQSQCVKLYGLEVLKQIKSEEKLRMMPVVVLTSSKEEKDMVASYKLGVSAYVVKPVDFHEFVNAIKELGVFWAVINEPPPGSVRN